MGKLYIGVFCVWFLLSGLAIAEERDTPNGLVGIRYGDNSFSVVTEKRCSVDFAREKFFELWSALVLPDSDFYIDLRPDRGISYQVPVDLWFVKWGSQLAGVDLRLKGVLREIISNMADPKIRDFWQKYLSEKNPKPIDLRMIVRAGCGEIIRLKDGVLVKSLGLKVVVEEPKPTELGELLAERLTMQINESADFESLRQWATAVLLAQYVKEQATLEGRRIPFKSEFGKKRIISVRRDTTCTVAQIVQDLVRLYIKPIEIVLRGYRLRISGAIDFTSMMSACEVKDVPVTVSEAIEKLGRFYLANIGKAKISQQQTEVLIESYLKDRQMVPFWRKLFPSYRKEMVALKWAYALLWRKMRLSRERIKLGSKIKVRDLKGALRKLSKVIGESADWVDLLPESGEIVFMSRFDPHLLPEEKAKRLRQAIESGVVPFISQLEKGEAIGLRIDNRNKSFLLALLDGNKKELNKFINSRIRKEFFLAIRRIKIDFEDPFLRQVYLLSLVDTYKKVLDPRLISVLPFIKEFLREFSGLDMYSGLVVSSL